MTVVLSPYPLNLIAYRIMQTSPVLLLAYGNPSRGDDALAPLLLEKIEVFCPNSIELLTDFQLQIEHALDLKQRELVLFIDASVANTHPVELRQLQAHYDNSYTTHAMNPVAVMQVYQDIEKVAPPPCFLLSLQGEAFELGAGLSQTAAHSLQLAIELTKKLVTQANLSAWQTYSRA